jgi:flavin reductase (DIM6/NTAB) family NADH-FMN oxidoreductase RutF/pimeloyl-ACP methyl ester carboxylesterase
LLPGITQTRKVWVSAAKALAQAGRYVISLDLRGHGGSDSPKDCNYSLEAFMGDLVAVLAQLESRPVVVGSNFGGWIGLAALGNTSAPIATGLVLTNPPPEFQSLNNESIAKTVSERASSEDFDQGLFAGGFDFIELQNKLEPAAKSLKLPTLLVRGIDSQVSSSSATQRFADLIPQAEVSEIEGAGHYVAFDKSDEFSALVLEFLERHVPHQPPQYVSGSDSRTLRDAMGCFATGITVVTTLDEAKTPIGLTVNSFSSVSLDPPLVSVCLDNHAGSLDVFRAAQSFAINVLHTGQQSISNLFASKGVDRFAGVDWSTWERNVPIIEGSLASFECIKKDMIIQGDHSIFIGEVVRAKFEPHRDPLLYFGGKYRRLHFG